MNPNEPVVGPPDDEESLAELFEDVFDLIDHTVESITDSQIEERLRRLLDTNGYEACPEFGSTVSIAGIEGSECVDHAALDFADVIRSVEFTPEIDAARREAAEILATAQKSAEASTAAAHADAERIIKEAEAYADVALQRAAAIMTDARDEAARIVADAKRAAAVHEDSTRAAISRLEPISIFVSFNYDESIRAALNICNAPVLSQAKVMRRRMTQLRENMVKMHSDASSSPWLFLSHTADPSEVGSADASLRRVWNVHDRLPVDRADLFAKLLDWLDNTQSTVLHTVATGSGKSAILCNLPQHPYVDMEMVYVSAEKLVYPSDWFAERFCDLATGKPISTPHHGGPWQNYGSIGATLPRASDEQACLSAIEPQPEERVEISPLIVR